MNEGEREALKEEIAYARGWQFVIALLGGGLIGWVFTADSQAAMRGLGAVTCIALTWGLAQLHKRIVLLIQKLRGTREG